MTRAKKIVMPFLVVFTAVILSGCLQRHPRSAYKAFYQEGLISTRIPTYKEIASAQDVQQDPIIGQPSERVWEACLDLATQSRGILGIETDENGGHRILFISGQNLEDKLGRWIFVDRWLALSVRPITESSTEVLISFVSPKTQRVAPFFADSFPKEFKGDDFQSVSLKAGAKFIEALKASLAKDDYLKDLDGYAEHRARGTPYPPDIKRAQGSESLEQRRGNFRSAVMRRERFVLNLPLLEKNTDNIIGNLARASMQPSRETKVFVVVGDFYETHVEPNGDIFITTGLLDKVHNDNELAGVLAHELAHLYLNHESSRARGFKLARMSTVTTLSLGTLGGAVVGGLFPTSTKPDSETPQITGYSIQEILVGAAVGLGGMYLGGQIGTGLGLGIGDHTIQQFSRKEELEADDYGAELLWAAGYDYHRFLKFLQSNVGLLESPRKKRP